MVATATIAIVTFVTLVLELTSTRLFAYVGSSHATSTALSIALLGLGVGAATRVRAPHRVRWAAPGLAIGLAAIDAMAIAGAGLSLLVAVALLPFGCAGMLVADGYALRGSGAARSTYAIDLGAAAIGCTVAPRLLGPLSPMQVIGALGLIACALAALRRMRVAAAIIALPLAGALAIQLPDGPLAALLRSDPRSEKVIVDTGASARDVVDSAWSPLGRLDVKRAPDDRLGVFTDGMSPTYMVRAGEIAFEDTWGLLMSLPYRALHPHRVLVLGAGAGASVWLAKHYGATRVDAVEVNPAITGVLAHARAFAGDVYHEPGVRLFVEDARRFLVDHDERYDLIELALALTGNAHAQPAGMEAHLYTVEAVASYLRRLAPDGALVLVHSDPGNAFRQLLTVLDALAELGIARDRALEGIAVLRDPRPGTAYRYELVVRTSPMPLDIADQLDVEPAELLWGPGDPPERRAQLLDPKQLGATDRDDLDPVHDDRPYFFQNTRGLVATALAEPGRLWVLVVALGLVVGLVGERAFARPAVAASCVGAAYLCVELALVQRFTLAAGGTLYAVSFVVFCVLGWSAIGALVFGDQWTRRARGASWACLAASLVVGATAWLAPELSSRVAIAAVLAPIGIALGGPFPTLLARCGQPARLWAINGVASVIGGISGVLALRVGGATDALLLAAGLYLVAAVAAPRA